MAGTSIDMSKVKQLLQLKQSGMSNRQIAKTLGISRDKANEFVKQAESDPLGIEGLLKLDDPVLDKRMHIPMKGWRSSFVFCLTLLSS